MWAAPPRKSGGCVTTLPPHGTCVLRDVRPVASGVPYRALATAVHLMVRTSVVISHTVSHIGQNMGQSVSHWPEHGPEHTHTHNPQTGAPSSTADANHDQNARSECATRRLAAQPGAGAYSDRGGSRARGGTCPGSVPEPGRAWRTRRSLRGAVRTAGCQ